MKSSKHILLAVIALALICMIDTATPAFGASRTTCFRLQLRDDRYNCADESETGARRGCNNGGYADAVGHQVELWDKDWGSDDEYIGTWYVSGGGTQCVTFEWENANYSKSEANPDTYLRYINIVNRTGYSNYVRVKAVKTGGGNHNATTWRNGQSGTPDRYVAMNCRAGTTCYMFPSGSLVPTNDPASERGQRIMALDSAQHTLQVFGEIADRHMKLHYPGKSSCPTSCADDRDDFHISGPQGGDGILVGHEIGHLLQMQQFGRDGLRNDCSKGSNGWSLTSDEWESCATQEGFASFVGVVSWYEPNNTATSPVGWGLDMDTATLTDATCSDNKGIPVQVAKAFWDMDDWNQESGAGAAASWDDDLAYGTTGLVRGWSVFPGGSGNRDNNESGRDGVNMRDYYWNNTGRYTAPEFFETFLRHNCLHNQTND